jgi:hypothetical protein
MTLWPRRSLSIGARSSDGWWIWNGQTWRPAAEEEWVWFTAGFLLALARIAFWSRVVFGGAVPWHGIAGRYGSWLLLLSSARRSCGWSSLVVVNSAVLTVMLIAVPRGTTAR